MEEGEINDPDSFGAAYSPELEWPGDTTPESSISVDTIQGQPAITASGNPYLRPAPSSSPPPRAHLDTSCLRLLVQRSTILPKRQSLAVLDGYTEAQLGRDAAPTGSEVPRIRLKEMEVSKLHATIYWDHGRREWAVVDMGSKHGTFLRSNRGPDASTSATDGQTTPHRHAALCTPVASIPRRLAHLDALSVGGTTFIVHTHEQAPCAECSPSAETEIPLIDQRTPDRQAEASRKRKRDAAERSAESDYITPVRDPKRALNDLRRNLLSRHVVPQTPAAQSQYTDRSALRRTRHPDAAPVSTPSRPHTTPVTRAPPVSIPAPTPRPLISAPPAPLPDSNIGHRLLMKQGWSPGESLGRAGSSDVALVEPLDVKGNRGRAGLGGAKQDYGNQPSPPAAGIDWKEAGKLRHWDTVRTRDLDGPR
ncbi:uncharacterized protein B0H18DRAFT_999764 [Fomitopsis serialis]|uniref:uncharacterized protein n=1 Tax=Fomitopsis serialis TaxID=139415 RepID=UPI002008563B|nr:uncharacterized protein B0H18DRAFT_999764 [Neoantrodia serialis]KAH9928630.1 hypothetical protein B0H18DRAFT_999764 [Neoantrodia serialis]